MKRRRVRFTQRACSEVQRQRQWWREHRAWPEMFVDELEEAIELLSLLPGAGTAYAASPTPGVHRLYLRRIDAHLYYTYDDFEVIVRSLWGARRRRGPQLRR